MSETAIRILSGEDVRAALTMEKTVGLMRDAFAQLSSGEATVPVRTNAKVDQHDTEALVMPVHLPVTDQLGVKAAVMNHQNPSRGLPLIHATMVVSDARTGVPLALLNGDTITNLRTGAGSGLATDLLARPEATIAAVFGAGTQARTQLEGVTAVRPIEKAYVVNRTAERAHRYAREMSERLEIDVIPASAETALAHADVVCTATTATDPLFRNEHLRPGTHINAVGAYRPDTAEIPAETVARAKIVVDHRESCLEEAGDLVRAIDAHKMTKSDIHAELGELVIGTRDGRGSDDEVTLFKSVGNAVQDLATAAHVIAIAEKDDLGTTATL